MSVVIECISVIVRRSEIERRFPGGLAAYKAACPNQTFCADRHLARVGFMDPRDVGIFMLRVLGRAGLASCPSGRREDIRIEADSVAIVEQGRGPWHPEHSRWLRYAVRSDGVPYCWLAGKPRGKLAAPPGWKPEHSLEYVKLDADVEGEPVALESLDTLPPARDGYVTLFQGRAYSDDDWTETASKPEEGGRVLGGQVTSAKPVPYKKLTRTMKPLPKNGEFYLCSLCRLGKESAYAFEDPDLVQVCEDCCRRLGWIW